MNNLFFWKDWHKTDKNSFYNFVAYLIILLYLTGLYWFKGLENVINWDVLSELDEIPTVLDTFSEEQLSFNINSNAYIIKERFLSSPMMINRMGIILFFGFYITGLVFLLTAFTKLPRYWFLGGMTALAGILITFRFENIFQSTNNLPFLLIFGVFAGTAFLINSYFNYLFIRQRSMIFGLLVIALGFIIQYTSKINQNIGSLSAYGLLSAIVITLLFIILVSHEIMAGLVWVVTKSAMKGNNLMNQFMIVSSIYLLNILLIFLEKNRFIDLNFLPISPYLLHFISVIIGIWGFYRYCEQSRFFNFATTGSAIYFGLAIVSSATILYAFATANDPLIEAFESFIITAQLCIGLAFFLYTLVNFNQPLKQGLSVHRVLYQPKFLELSIFRLAGTIVAFALIAFANYAPYNQLLAGYNNALGDYYYSTNDLKSAEVFYKEATHTDLHNHKSNYALASLAMKMDDKNNVGFFLKNAVQRVPSPQAYVGLSRTLQENDMFFDALFTLKEGERKFPKNQQILNNLAYLYEKAKVLDSTLIYLKKAEENCTNCDLAESNLLYFDLKYNSGKIAVEKYRKADEVANYQSLRANRTALRVLTNSKFSNAPIKIPSDSLLDVSTFALIYNESQNKNGEFQIPAKTLQKIQQKVGNEEFMIDLAYARACQNYYHENKIEGIKQLSVLASDSSSKQKMYSQTTATWFLQNGVYDKAIEYLGKANDYTSIEALEKQNYKQNIADSQKKQSLELLNQGSIEEAYRKAPLNPFVLQETVGFLNKQKKEKQAYDLAFEAIQLNDKSAELWKIYTLQSLRIGMKEYAEDGLLNLELLLPSADYNAFISTYQAQKALMEKNIQGFE